MNTRRRSRLITVAFLFVVAGAGVAMLLVALEENINMFYPPDQVVQGVAPLGLMIRAGGMVRDGSVTREPNSLTVRFVLTDYQGHDFTVRYTGILPDLFREGQGVLVRGQLQPGTVFAAEEVLAKHDENYMPPELVNMEKAPDATMGKRG